VARIRSIKPRFCHSKDIVCLSIPCRLHFAMLWTYADDEGRGEDEPTLIKAALWPWDEVASIEQVDRWQDELAVAGRIVRYRDAEGRRYFQIDKFTTHQRPNRRVDSSIPPPEECEQVQSSASRLFEHNHGSPVVVVVGGDVGGESTASALAADAPVDNVRQVTSLRSLLHAEDNGAKTGAR
jgi:hypothetical protein